MRLHFSCGPFATSDRTECSAGLEHEEGTAADLVQCALGRLTHDDEPPSVDAVDEVAAALQEAILEGAAPLTSVIAVGDGHTGRPAAGAGLSAPWLHRCACCMRLLCFCVRCRALRQRCWSVQRRHTSTTLLMSSAWQLRLLVSSHEVQAITFACR